MINSYEEDQIEFYANLEPPSAAPNNSDLSDEYLDIWSDESVDEVVEILPKVKVFDKFAAVDSRVWQISNYDTEVMRDYPYKARENMVPLNLLKKKTIAHFETMHKQIAEMFVGDNDIEECIVDFKYNYFSMEHV